MSSQEAVFFFWHDMALYVGPVVPSDPHAHFCLELTLPLDGELDANLADGSRADGIGGALVGSNVAHRHRIRGRRMAQLIVGPLTRSGRALRAGLGRRPVGAISVEEAEPFRQDLAGLVDDGDLDRARVTAHSLVRHLSPIPPEPPADPRVLRTMQRLLGEFERNSPVRDLARQAGISESHLSHLFRRVVGVPVRTYRRWLRLRAGVILGMSGWDLSDAAHEAGFADQADFSRSCREAFGAPPSTITQRPISVFVGRAEPSCSLMSALSAGKPG